MSQTTQGWVDIVLDGEKKTLKPSLRCMQILSRQYGGLAKVREGILNQDPAVACSVIQLGLAMTDNQARDLPEKVYRTGMMVDTLVPLLEFVGIIGNGGRPLDQPTDDGGSAAKPDTEGNE